ncbi:hypothetical protein Ae717Ps2_4665c [Pseudonocardia sp. Ae717_Ps2]|uniref:hypothetical protein n=1 Tax=Pseudonocardia sp. Ae717_Ps2 TaxID=1885573 RepID=UPI00094AEA3F|nr:hypothetical protein [Pseudonocardia sp. Ae717_Ps2]OLM33769.1 hypothetical protein Ae717Ps2_4665c [Pseudonocardia sp. Ae717_Ps2]
MSTGTWAERRREDRAAAAELARRDADAATERALHVEAVRAEIAERRRTEKGTRDEAARAARVEQTRRARAERRKRAAARRSAVGVWAAAHRVDLLIYPLAVASAVMAVPAMAAYGVAVYGSWTGAVLPVLSELGMWAFALAVQSRRRTHPGAPLWALQAGVWAFAAVAAGLNVAHGLDAGVSTGLVMGVVSVAGVIAHQLVTAGARPARRARTERAAERKLRAARRAALRAAVAQIDTDGDARLVHAPGVYRVERDGLGRPVLAPHTTPGLPVDDDGGDLAAEVSAWLAEQNPGLLSVPVPSADDRVDGTGNHTEDPGEIGTEDDRPDGHGVATLDRPTGPTGGEHGRRRPRKVARPRARSMDALRAEFAAAVAAGEVDPSSAESIRTGLRCAPARARALRDEHRTDQS